MRVEGSNNLEPQGLVNRRPVAGGSSESQAAAGSASAAKTTADETPVLQRSYENYIAQAAAVSEFRPDAVEAARKALAAGEFDTPEASLRTAEALLLKGV